MSRSDWTLFMFDKHKFISSCRLRPGLLLSWWLSSTHGVVFLGHDEKHQ